MANINHNKGLPELVAQVGFSIVKYFEGNISSSPTTLSIDPPARRLLLHNTDKTNSVYFRVNKGAATTAVGLIPGDDIKVAAGGIFIMDFDTIHELSLVSGSVVFVEVTLGFQGVDG